MRTTVETHNNGIKCLLYIYWCLSLTKLVHASTGFPCFSPSHEKQTPVNAFWIHPHNPLLYRWVLSIEPAVTALHRTYSLPASRASSNRSMWPLVFGQCLAHSLPSYISKFDVHSLFLFGHTSFPKLACDWFANQGSLSDGGDRRQEAMEWVQALCSPVGVCKTEYENIYCYIAVWSNNSKHVFSHPISILLPPFPQLTITDFSRSFADGLAFCAIMYGLFPGEVPYSDLNALDRRRNFSLAFDVSGLPLSSSFDLFRFFCRIWWLCKFIYLSVSFFFIYVCSVSSIYIYIVCILFLFSFALISKRMVSKSILYLRLQTAVLMCLPSWMSTTWWNWHVLSRLAWWHMCLRWCARGRPCRQGFPRVWGLCEGVMNYW